MWKICLTCDDTAVDVWSRIWNILKKHDVELLEGTELRMVLLTDSLTTWI